MTTICSLTPGTITRGVPGAVIGCHDDPGRLHRQGMSLPLLAATLLLPGGNVDTLDPPRPRAEAVVARDGVIAFVGPEAEARQRAGPAARVIDLKGKTVLPGFTDAHGHLGGLGALERGALDLRDCKSFDDVVEA